MTARPACRRAGRQAAGWEASRELHALGRMQGQAPGMACRKGSGAPGPLHSAHEMRACPSRDAPPCMRSQQPVSSMAAHSRGAPEVQGLAGAVVEAVGRKAGRLVAQ